MLLFYFQYIANNDSVNKLAGDLSDLMVEKKKRTPQPLTVGCPLSYYQLEYVPDFIAITIFYATFSDKNLILSGIPFFKVSDLHEAC